MKIEFVNAAEVKLALNRVQKKLESTLDKELAGAAMRTAAIAKERLQPLPGDSREMAFIIGGVKQSINFTYDKSKKEAGVFAGNTGDDHMAAYLEFGTGVYAAAYLAGQPAWFGKLARRFYVNGKGRLRTHQYLLQTYVEQGKRVSERIKNLKVDW